MTRHELERHAESLAIDVLGTTDPRKAFEASSLASCTACRELVEAHLHLARRLDRVGVEERAEIDLALASPPSARGRAEQRLLDEIRRRPPAAPPARRPARPWIWMLGAAAVLLIWLLWGTRSPLPESDRRTLLGTEIEIHSPVGEVESFGAFRWNYGALGSGWFQVVVTPADAPPGAEPYESGPLWTNEWNPSLELIEKWGTRIRWRVEVYSGTGGGALLDSRPATAWLPSR